MREIEHLSRLYVAYLFVCAEETKLKSNEELQEMQTSIAQLQENMRQNEAKVKELSAEIQELERKRDKVSSRADSLGYTDLRTGATGMISALRGSHPNYIRWCDLEKWKDIHG